LLGLPLNTSEESEALRECGPAPAPAALLLVGCEPGPAAGGAGPGAAQCCWLPPVLGGWGPGSPAGGMGPDICRSPGLLGSSGAATALEKPATAAAAAAAAPSCPAAADPAAAAPGAMKLGTLPWLLRAPAPGMKKLPVEGAAPGAGPGSALGSMPLLPADCKGAGLPELKVST
jgi:hypothetical protein